MNSNSRYALVFYLISPFLALLSAIYNYRSRWAKNILWLFVAFYGFTFVISTGGIDANRYRDKFLFIAQNNLGLTDLVNRFSLLGDSEYTDLLQPLISTIVAYFTSDHRFLFAAFGLVFGYFYSRNLWFLIEQGGNKIKNKNFIFLFTFAFIIGFWSINGFRMWTAAHIFFFGTIHYLMKKERKGFLIAASSIFVHFVFLVPVLVLSVFVLFRARIHLFFWFFILTFFVSELNIDSTKRVLYDYAPNSAVQAKVRSYTNESYLARLEERAHSITLTWHARYYRKALNWSIVILLTFMYFSGLPLITENKPLQALFAFTLLFSGISNIASQMPSGGRFIIIANLFAVSSIFFFMQKVPAGRWINRVMIAIVPALLFFCIVSLREGFDTLGVMTVLGNPALALFGNIDIALIELIK